MRVRIVSDVHIGSRYFLRDRFLAFLDALPPDAELVLNGDTLDHPRRRLVPADQAVLERLFAEARRRRVVWIVGNHDAEFALPAGVPLAPVRSVSYGRRLHVQHGYGAGPGVPAKRVVFGLIRRLHALRVVLGAEAMHIARYAKRWPALYDRICDRIRQQAARDARLRGFEAVACGHTHRPEDTVVDGVRFLNTGAWTEEPVCFAELDDQALRFVRF